MEIHVDNRFANGPGAKSIFGFHYKSKLEPYVTTSSTEAEFIAMSLTIQEVKWVLSILEELGVPASLVILFCDNQGAMKIVRNASSTGRTRHINLRLQYAQEEVLSGRIKLSYVNSNDNVADVFRKPLGRIAFEKLKDRMLVSDKEGDS